MSPTDRDDEAVTARPRILLVEDNDAASRGLSRILELQGFEVQVVSDGTSALRHLETGPPPDFVLTDLSLPDFDGREVARHASRVVPTPRIALITGWDIEDDPDSQTACGIDWVFSKPLDIKALILRLNEARKPEDHLD